MNTGKCIKKMNILRHTVMMLLVYSVLLSFANAADEKAVKKPAEARVKPLVVMKQAEINGRVFFLAEDDKDYVASKLSIKVIDLEDDTVIQTTITDENGRYKLKNLDAGEYRFMVGLLRLKLRVEDSAGVGKSIPKTILVFIPVELGGKR